MQSDLAFSVELSDVQGTLSSILPALGLPIKRADLSGPLGDANGVVTGAEDGVSAVAGVADGVVKPVASTVTGVAGDVASPVTNAAAGVAGNVVSSKFFHLHHPEVSLLTIYSAVGGAAGLAGVNLPRSLDVSSVLPLAQQVVSDASSTSLSSLSVICSY